MNNTDISLLVTNYNEFDKVGGFFSSMDSKRGSAFSLTVKGIRASVKKIEEAVDVIKKNTSAFSRFRGNNLYVIATKISLQEDMERAFGEIKTIYKKLKEKFSSSDYLILTALVIFDAKDKVDVGTLISDTDKAYKIMKKDHCFITGAEDTVTAAMIAVTSKDIEKKMIDTEKYYNTLKSKGYWSGDSLQTLSHILVLFEGIVDENIEKVVSFDKTLRDNKIKIKSTTLPLLAVSAFLSSHPKDFAQEVRKVDDQLKEVKGFGGFSMGSEVRNMMSVGLVAVNYSKDLDESTKENVINTTNSISLTIEIAMEMAMIATMVAASSAAAASSASS
ncbi:MAG: DUF4003 family protein [Sarcina sp.]